MLETSLQVIKRLEEAGFESYIVGGFVRDYLMNRESIDVDITTAARPREIKEIFNEVVLPKEDYGAVSLFIKNYRFEITTFRKELSYYDDRKPKQIEYIDDLLTDLKRRDFRMNTICMNSEAEIVDLLGGQKDIEDKLIRPVEDAIFKFYEDPLRILRAIRFATTLNFDLSKEIIDAIYKTKSSLKRLSYQRKREELDKIFSNSSACKGIKLLLDLDLDKELEIYNLEKVKVNCDLIGIWASLDVDHRYPFSKNEQELIKKIKEVINKDNLDTMVLYDYGLYVNTVAACIKGLDKKELIKKYENLSIKSKNEIQMSSRQIIKLFNGKTGAYISEIMKDLEKQILLNNLLNEPKTLEKYIIEKYGEQNERESSKHN